MVERSRRNFLVSPTNHLEQGLIFNSCHLDNYPGKDVFGLIITARCDIEHKKAAVFNYLPVVRFRDWVEMDGGLIFLERLKKVVMGQMRSMLLNANLSPSLLLTHSPIDIHKVNFTGAKGEEKFAQIGRQWVSIDKNWDEIAFTDRMGLYEAYPKIRKEMFAQLIRNDLNGYYFLEDIEVSGDSLGFVVLLREILRMPSQLASRVADGLSYVDFCEISRVDPSLGSLLRVPEEGMCMPISLVNSPFVEHLMQAFSSLFSRIGIDDIPEDYIATLWEKNFETPQYAKTSKTC